MRALHLIGRAMFGGFFLYSGINRLQSSKGRAAEQAVHATGAMLIGGGLSVVAGIKPRQGLAAIVALLVPVTLQMHRFWDEQDPQARQVETMNFVKNLALMGAALAMMGIDEPWPASVDGALSEEEMFIRLGGRDLRSLPA